MSTAPGLRQEDSCSHQRKTSRAGCRVIKAKEKEKQSESISSRQKRGQAKEGVTVLRVLRF
jgi:hypothetical protein